MIFAMSPFSIPPISFINEMADAPTENCRPFSVLKARHPYRLALADAPSLPPNSDPEFLGGDIAKIILIYKLISLQLAAINWLQKMVYHILITFIN